MERQIDQFSSEDQQDDEEQEKLTATISSILDSSLGDQEDTGDSSKSAVEGHSTENHAEETLETNSLISSHEENSIRETLSYDSEPSDKESPSNQEDVEDIVTDAELSTAINDIRETSDTPGVKSVESDIATTIQHKEVTSDPKVEGSISTVKNDKPRPVDKQGEYLMEVMDHTVVEENTRNITEAEQFTPKKRSRSSTEPGSVETTEDDCQMSQKDTQEDVPSPEKRWKRNHVQAVQSNVIDGQLSEPPFSKKRGRPSKKFDNLAEENEDLDKRISLRATTKIVHYNEQDSSPEKDSKDIVTKDTVHSIEEKSENSDTKKRRTSFVKSTTGKRPALRRPRHMNSEEDDSFFLPENWYFYAKIRHDTKHYDLYYLTPPPKRMKVRSRQELVHYCNARGLNYDPLQFFNKKNFDHLLAKGILKHHDSHTIILTSNPEVIEYLPVKSKPRSKSFNNQNQIIKTEDNTLQTPPVKKEMKQPKEVSKNPVIDSKQKKVLLAKKSPFRASSRISSPKAEPLSPPGHSGGLDTSLIMTKENSVETSLSAPLKKKPGRPRKNLSGVTTDHTPSKEKIGEDKHTEEKPNEAKPEEKVRIRSKPPRKSPYFSSSLSASEKSKSLAGLRRERKSCDAPPRSPYNLIQEDLFHDPWQMLIATIFLNATSGKIAIPLALEFLKRWPTPQLARQAKVDDILDLIEPLGFGRTRAAIILRFSHEFLTKDWKFPNELYGIGDYGNDSYKIFCMRNEWKNVRSDDPMLMMYLNWRRATEHLRRKFLKPTNTPLTTDMEYPTEVNKKVLRPRATPSPRKRTRTK